MSHFVLKKSIKLDTWVMYDNFNKKIYKIFIKNLCIKFDAFSRRYGSFISLPKIDAQKP